MNHCSRKKIPELILSAFVSNLKFLAEKKRATKKELVFKKKETPLMIEGNHLFVKVNGRNLTQILEVFVYKVKLL